MDNKTARYDLIYADPPWHFGSWSRKGMERSADRHYQTQDLEYLKQMNVPAVCSRDCTLLMWATFPCLQQALELAGAWGFVYKTIAFVWVKTNRKSDGLFTGMGYYTRANAEIVLLFTRGKPLKRMSKSIRQVLISPIERHSKKPSEIRKRIEELFGQIRRIELFARCDESEMDNYKGWDVFGNEAFNSVRLPD